MKTRTFWTLAISVIISLPVLAGCDTPTGDEGYWLAGVANPLIGTWSYGGNSMQSGQSREFKNDGTVVTTNLSDNTSTTLPYLIKDNFFVISSASSPYYTKYFFEVIDNNTLKIIQDGKNITSYTRAGTENPDANRNITLSNGMDGFWRRDNLNFGTEETTMFMYDWYTFSKNGTYHVYHYMNKNKHYVDRGDFSYFIDNDNRLISLSNGYTVTVYYDFTKSNGNAFSWKTTSGGEASGFEKFDGETFWHSAE
jgi:hypothetical protein